MTRDEQLIRAALEMAAKQVTQGNYGPVEGHYGPYDHLTFIEKSIRAIDPAEVLAQVRTRCAECDCGAGDRSWIASGSSGAWRVHVKSDDPEEWVLIHPKVPVDWIERKGVECPPLYTRPAPDAVARLVEAAVAEYSLEPPMQTHEERLGRRSAIRGMMVRLGLYKQFTETLAAMEAPNE